MTFERTLQDRFSAASDVLPGRPLDWTETFARARRRRRMHNAVVVFASAVVLGLGGTVIVAVIDSRDRAPEPFRPAQTESPAPPTPTPASPTPTEEPEPGVDSSFERPFRAVDDFIDAAAAGDPEKMWALMTIPSRAVYDDDFERFREFALSEVAEGWGSWAAAEDLTKHWQVVASSGDGVMGVVTLMGSRAPEGHEEPFASAAIPVRVDSRGDARVELFVSRGTIDFATPRDLRMGQPPALDTIATDRPSFEAVVPATPSEVDMVAAPVPDEPVVSAFGMADIEDAGKGRARAVWSPEERLFAGEWFLTVLAIYEDGSMQADSVRFTID